MQLQLCEQNYSCVILTQERRHTRVLNCLQPPTTRDRHVLDTDHCQSQLSPDGLSIPSLPPLRPKSHTHWCTSIKLTYDVWNGKERGGAESNVSEKIKNGGGYLNTYTSLFTRCGVFFENTDAFSNRETILFNIILTA